MTLYGWRKPGYNPVFFLGYHLFFIKQFFKKKKARRVLVDHRGDHYDLKAIYDQINGLYFANALDLRITWAGSKKAAPKRSIRLGSYHMQTQVIRIHRFLDQAHIPDYYISFIVYHEMLHHVLPPVRGRRTRIHHPEYKAREKEFQEYALAKEYGEQLRKQLFASRR